MYSHVQEILNARKPFDMNYLSNLLNNFKIRHVQNKSAHTQGYCARFALVPDARFTLRHPLN